MPRRVLTVEEINAILANGGSVLVTVDGKPVLVDELAEVPTSNQLNKTYPLERVNTQITNKYYEQTTLVAGEMKVIQHDLNLDTPEAVIVSVVDLDTHSCNTVCIAAYDPNSITIMAVEDVANCIVTVIG